MIAVAMLAAVAFPAFAAQPQTGLLERSYAMAEAAGMAMPYSVYVPKSYDRARSWPLVMVLHGAGGDHRTVFANSNLAEVAEQRGAIVVAPLGYNAFGGWGVIYPTIVTANTAKRGSKAILGLSRTAGMTAPPSNPARSVDEPPAGADEAHVEVPPSDLADPEASRLSETDAMNVLARAREEFNVDPARIYLMGNSMGGVGTAYLAVKYPKVWAAISPSGGVVAAWAYPAEHLQDAGIAALFVHGEKDEHGHYRFNKALVDSARAKGGDIGFLLVQGGSHSRAWITALPQTFDFLLSHRRKAD
jgi:poly(3-hydroxybutyrate) depolymerase